MKRCHFDTIKESVRKDVERTFGVLQADRGAAMMWDPKTLCQVITCCVILHNTIMEDKGEGGIPHK